MIEKSNILVVDDAPTNINLIRRFLEPVDVDILTAESGELALGLLDKNQFSLIILDIQMPGMDGFELAERIRARAECQHIPLMFLSAVFSTEQSALKGIHTGAVDFMTKPTNWPILVNKVKSFVFLDQQTKKLKHEIEQRKQVQEQLYSEKELLQITFESIGDAVITTDVDSRITYINPVGETITGWSKVDAMDRPVTEVFKIIDEDSREPIECPIRRSLEERKIVGLEGHVQLISQSGKEYSIQDSSAPIFNKKRRLIGAVLIFSDVTNARQLARELAYQANHDPLTELMNRRAFENRLQRIVESVQQNSGQHALLFLDLDQFKLINDAGGHSAGDELLQQISIMLGKNIRARDCLGRLGGDEFAIILEHCDPNTANMIAEKLRKAIADLHFRYNNKTYKTGISIGVMPITDTASCVAGLMKNADAACYAAKRGGRNQVKLYDKADGVLSQQQNEIEWVSKIHNALESDVFELFYQPIRAINNDLEPGIEILLRIRSENGQMISPSAFLPSAERYGLVTQIDQRVVQLIFQWLHSIPVHLQKFGKISINLSGQSLGNEDFLNFIISEIESKDLPSEKICFEITETAMIENIRHAKSFIAALRDRGCKFALDDFGKGLSSFAYIKDLAVDYLKIDGIFVKNILTNPVDMALVNSINDIGHVLGKQTIAEFVETPELLEAVIDLGVDYAQGYAIGKPAPINLLHSEFIGSSNA